MRTGMARAGVATHEGSRPGERILDAKESGAEDFQTCDVRVAVRMICRHIFAEHTKYCSYVFFARARASFVPVANSLTLPLRLISC